MNAPLTTCTTMIATLALGAVASAQFAVDPATNYVIGVQPSGIAAGDFNGDGFIDLGSATDAPDAVSTLLNTGAGTFGAGPFALLGSSTSAQDVVSGRFNGDALADLAVAVRDPNGAVVILHATGGGSFIVAQTVLTGDRPRGLSAVDSNGDGIMDMIGVANRDGDSASVLTNNGSGLFTGVTLPAGGEPRSTTFGDWDGDGDKDFAVTNHDDRTVGIYTNTGGSFSQTGTLFVIALVRPDGITSADLDGNGMADLAVAVSDQTLGINQAQVFLNFASIFSGPVGYNTGGTNTSQVTAADLDCDGITDLALVNQDSGNISLLRNMGGGVFMAPQILAAGTTPGDVVAADLDGDGDADLAVENRDSNNVSVYINQTCTIAPCPADVDGDLSVGFGDLLSVLANWGPCPGCPQDINGDNVVGFPDLLAVLSDWGACP